MDFVRASLELETPAGVSGCGSTQGTDPEYNPCVVHLVHPAPAPIPSCASLPSGGDVALSLSWPFNQGHVFPLPSLQQHWGFAQCTVCEFREQNGQKIKPWCFGQPCFGSQVAGRGRQDVTALMWSFLERSGEEGGVLSQTGYSCSPSSVIRTLHSKT